MIDAEMGSRTERTPLSGERGWCSGGVARCKPDPIPQEAASHKIEIEEQIENIEAQQITGKISPIIPF